jgi:leucyl aminopeptidase
MEFGVRHGELRQQRTGCVVVAVHEGGGLSASAAKLDELSHGAIRSVIARGDHQGRLGTALLLDGSRDAGAERMLLVGAGRDGEQTETGYRKAVASAIGTLRETGAAEAAFCLHEVRVADRDVPWKIEQAVLAIREGLYRFDALKSDPDPAPPLEKVFFQAGNGAPAAQALAAIERGVAIAEGITLARDLGNMPGNLCTPTYLAGHAIEVGKRHGFKVEVLDREQLEQLGMGAFLAVARGSLEPPKLIVMEWEGASSDARPVVLVGKGITFDAGGISIKPALEMDEMKFDMCGAASVFGALRAAALMDLRLNLVGIIPAAENMPGGNATRPGDIVTTMSGQTVEILDTDSEGRLALCDALTFAEKYDPLAVIDVATLTGEIVKALGDVATGLFSNDDALAREVLAAGERAWDRAWQMPLWDDYQDALRSNFADLPNIGSQADSAVTAACFLSRFTKRYPWAHLDIAGTASRSGENKGATGRPVALLAHFLAARAATYSPSQRPPAATSP